MKKATYLCNKCGALLRYDHDRYLINPKQDHYHCQLLMVPLTTGQSYVASHLELNERLSWLSNGAYYLKGPSRNKRWIPAMKPDEIKASIEQKAAHKSKRPSTYRDQYLEKFNEIASPYIEANNEAFEFLKNLNRQLHFVNILFISLEPFRKDIYRFIKEYDLGSRSRRYLEEFLAFLISLVYRWDEEIVDELNTLWKEKRLSELDNNRKVGSAKDVFNLKRFMQNSGIVIKQPLKRE